MRVAPFLMLLTAAACARPSAPAGADLARTVAGRTEGAPQSCVAASSNEAIRPVDSSTLAYGWGSTIYINRLGGACPGITDLSTVFVENSSGHYCRGDRIRGRELGAIIPGPPCNLGNWVPYTR